jgi:pimeloyl-ACP methyl ester carboxylesterase
MRPRVRNVAIAAGAAAGVSALAYVGERLAAARIRRAPDEDAPRALEEPIYASHSVASHDHGTIHVIEAGEGPPIVLSHGVLLSVRTWFHQLDELPRDGFRVVAFDHRGHGASVAGDTGHSIENLAADVRTVLEQLDVRDAVLVGHSMGGVAVQAFAIHHPDVARERVRGLVLLSTIAKTPLSGAIGRLERPIERMFEHLPDSTKLFDARNFGFVLSRVGFGKKARPSHVELVRRMLRDTPDDTRRLAIHALVGLDLTPDLPKIDLPTLVIGGTADVLTPPAESRRMASLIPGARLELIPGGGHMLMFEEPEKINALLRDFAREVQAPRLPRAARA